MTQKTTRRTLWRELPDGRLVQAHLELREGEDEPRGLSPGFSATSSTWEPRSNARGLTRMRRGLEADSGGCDHETLLLAFPELAPIVRVHLADPDGTPMHALANAWYFYRGGHEAYELEHYGAEYVARHGTGPERACRTLRVPFIPDDLGEQSFAEWVETLRPLWRAEAAAARALLEAIPDDYAQRGYGADGSAVRMVCWPMTIQERDKAAA